MMSGELIDLGCCLDYQKLARTAELSPPDKCALEHVSLTAGTEIRTLRERCLTHQREIVTALRQTQDERDEDLRKLTEEIDRARGL